MLPAFEYDSWGFPTRNDLDNTYLVLTKTSGDTTCLARTVFPTDAPEGIVSAGLPKYEYASLSDTLIGTPSTSVRDSKIEVQLAPNQAVNYDFPIPPGLKPKHATIDLWTIRDGGSVSGQERGQRFIFRCRNDNGNTAKSLITRSLTRLGIGENPQVWDSNANINTSIHHAEASDADVILGFGQADNLNYVGDSNARLNEINNCPYGTVNPDAREYTTTISVTMTNQLFRLSIYRVYFGGITRYANFVDSNTLPDYAVTPWISPFSYTTIWGNVLYSWD